ncbi:MAG: hypothetical protein CMJ58_19735 [Planctomycetaceae bacterium]|nr:hypothetical protein [Planctomycetaceae bacterium]
MQNAVDMNDAPEAAVRPLSGLLRAVEVWRPSDEGDHLVWGGGAYGELDELRAASVDETFACGEGLPGAAWETRSPVVMHQLSAGNFKRADAARATGVTAGVALPCFRGDELQGIVVFLCGDDPEAQGAFEVWSRNHREELGLSASYYANLERFGLISQYVKFPRGSGLPGETWVSRFPKLISRLGQSKGFMRAAGAAADGLSTALSIPIMRSSLDLDSVVLMLSSARAPLAHAFEIWAREQESDSLRICQADYGQFVNLQPGAAKLRYQVGEGLAGGVWDHGVPEVTEELPVVESARGEALAEIGLTTALAWPVYVSTELAAVINLFL